VVGTGILGLACGAFWESSKSRNSQFKIIPLAGIALTFVSALITLSLIWQISSWNQTAPLKTLAVSLIFAFSLAQLSLLSLADLSKRFEWILTGAVFVALVLASILSVLIIVEPGSESDFVMRLIGVLAVTDAALTVMIFHRLSRGSFAVPQTEISKIDEEIAKLKDDLSRLEKKRDEILKKAE
jgi:hypothetical protein